MSNFMKIRPVGAELAAFRNFANAPNSNTSQACVTVPEGVRDGVMFKIVFVTTFKYFKLSCFVVYGLLYSGTVNARNRIHSCNY
jgi:hypothetical protein